MLKEAAEKAATQLKQINRLNTRYSKEYAKTVEEVSLELANNGIHVLKDDVLSERQSQCVMQFYRAKLIGRISPVWFENLHDFDKEADDNIYMIVRMKKEGVKPLYALFPLPVDTVGRWYVLPDAEDEREVNVMYLEDVIRVCLPLVFPGFQYDSYEAWTFKFTRDAEMEIDNDLREGFMQKIQKGVKSRKAGCPVRIVYDASMPNGALRRIKLLLAEGERLDASVSGGRYQNHRDFMAFPDCGRKELSYPKWQPIMNKELHNAESIFKVIREKDCMLHMPYHSFDGYIRLLILYIVEDYRACATAAFRDAKNGKKILQHVRKTLKLDIDIITGDEEARILRDCNPMTSGNLLYMDVGGGSTELSLVCDGQLIDSRSFNIGTLRMLSGTVSQSKWEEMKNAVAEFCQDFDNIQIVGSGGNINKLYRLTPKRVRKADRMMVCSLRKLHTNLSALTVEQRMEQYELREDRADVIVPAAELFLMVAEVAKAEDIIVPTVGLADGIINELTRLSSDGL